MRLWLVAMRFGKDGVDGWSVVEPVGSAAG